MSITRVGVVVTCPSDEELQLRAAEWGDLNDADVPPAGTDGLLLFEFALFADLPTGERLVEANGGSWAFETRVGGGGIIELDGDRSVGDLAGPLSDLVSEHARRDLANARSAEARWAPLIELLEAAGHRVTPDMLERLPVEVEFSPSAAETLHGGA